MSFHESYPNKAASVDARFMAFAPSFIRTGVPA